MARRKIRFKTIPVKAYWNYTAAGDRYRVPAHKRRIAVPVVAKVPVRKPVIKVPPRKPSIKAPARKPVVKAPVQKPVVKAPVKKTPGKVPVKKPAPRKPVRKPPVKRPEKKPVIKKPVRKPVKKLAVKKPVRKPVAKKPVKRLKKKLPRGPKRKKIKKKYPPFIRRAMVAENLIQEKLFRMLNHLEITDAGLQMSVRSFINSDSTVDGELRISNLPDEWRTLEGLPLIISALSLAIDAMGAFTQDEAMGGRFWVSFGLRFGPKNQAEIEEMAKFYKRFRGLFQVGAHHASAHDTGAIKTNALAIRLFVENIWAKRDLPPVQILVRFVWTPTKKNPGRDAKEIGGRYAE